MALVMLVATPSLYTSIITSRLRSVLLAICASTDCQDCTSLPRVSVV